MKAIVLAFAATLVGCELSAAASLTGATFFTAGPQGNTSLEVWTPWAAILFSISTFSMA